MRFDETLRVLVQQYRGVLVTLEQLQTQVATLEVELPSGIKDFAPGGYVRQASSPSPLFPPHSVSTSAMPPPPPLKLRSLLPALFCSRHLWCPPPMSLRLMLSPPPCPTASQSLTAVSPSVPPNPIQPCSYVTIPWISERRAALPGQLGQAQEALQRLVDSLPAQRLALAGLIQEGKDLVGSSVGMMRELSPLLEPVVKTGNATAGLVLDRHKEWVARFHSYLTAAAALATDGGLAQIEDPAVQQVVMELSAGGALGPELARTYSDLCGQLMSLRSDVSTYNATGDNDDPNGDDENGAGEPASASPAVTRMAQEKSAHAVGIWKRVRAKLEGVDSSKGKLGVAEQVERTIAAAKSSENLCVMYEGWSAWI